MPQTNYDAVVLGGGPAGSTVATILAQAGCSVVVLEKEHFPRYHIGESLLPATVSLFDRLGVHEAIRASSIHKPGGKWLYGDGEVPGDFAKHDRHASFSETPYSYLVERAEFDRILLERSAECGAEVRFGHEVTGLIEADGRVVGVHAVDDGGNACEVRGRLVFDATGLRALVGSLLRIRQPAPIQRMGIYATYQAAPNRQDVDDGWFVGQMFHDGWTWLINQPGDRISVGAVLPVKRFRKMGLTPEEVLERLCQDNGLLRDGMKGAERVSEVRVTGNMGNSCRQLAGPGWVLVGDAAFFVDPCYSSGVHLAMLSGARAADIFLAEPKEQPICEAAYGDYDRGLRRHEKYVTRMVDAFYMASRNTGLQRLIVRLQGGYLSRKFVTFVGGDFSKNRFYISRVFLYSKLLGRLLKSDRSRAADRPDYPGGETSAPATKPEDCTVMADV